MGEDSGPAPKKAKSFIQNPPSKLSWQNGLLQTLKEAKSIVLEDDLIVVIKDKYPKAEYHYLVCPKEDIRDLKALKTHHLSLLLHMAKIGGVVCNKHKNKKFLIGYHAVPSMVRLHLHVISDDFNSPYLKTKKHWNSFTTAYFRNSDDIIKELQSGEIKHFSSIKVKELLNTSLKCHKCDYTPKTMPDLKKHILIHL